jgi:hypothetical protein
MKNGDSDKIIMIIKSSMMTVIRSYHQSHFEYDDSDEIIMTVMVTVISSKNSYRIDHHHSNIEYDDNDKIIIIKVILSMMTLIRSSKSYRA